jgi:hypothetical protein
LRIDPGTPVTNTVSLVAMTNFWRYFFNHTDQGTAWRAPGFDDGAWSNGLALLYLEEDPLPAPKNTLLPGAPTALPITSYFRARFRFDPPNPSHIASVSLIARTVVDDGVACYLNGSDLLRLGVDANATFTTDANRTVGNAALEGPFEVSGTSLVLGDNVLAAELHQSSASSADAAFGMSLDAMVVVRTPDTNPADGGGGFADTRRDRAPARLDLRGVRFAVTGVEVNDLLINGAPATGTAGRFAPGIPVHVSAAAGWHGPRRVGRGARHRGPGRDPESVWRGSWTFALDSATPHLPSSSTNSWRPTLASPMTRTARRPTGSNCSIRTLFR